ncbi:hypothetical protein [Sphingobacterium prati]|uniref:hypothetical protein n=1 Tax=Sphingobacterium prati TaxID=2737006 RepID=UPI0015539471|nr:hypothetical protein [Sphingobacterium prati]NPE48460.1 hypothetical protein [Sphingobacterium prati]
MKNYLTIYLLFFLTIVSCKKNTTFENEIQNGKISTKASAISDPNDQNLNSWNWANQSTALIYFLPKINGAPSPSYEVSLPWTIQNNPVNNNFEQDYKPEFGWVLYLKDFGTPERPAQTPFFALYNKYSGVLRFFVYNYRVKHLSEGSKTHYVGILGFLNPNSHKNGLLSFYANPRNSVVDSIDASVKQIVATQKNKDDTWLNFDYTLTAFDPNSITSPGNELDISFNVYGVNSTDIALGTDFSTLISRSSAGASGSDPSKFSQYLNTGYEVAGHLETILKAFPSKSAQSINSLNNHSSPLKANTPNQAVVNSKPKASFIGAITLGATALKGIIGIVKSFSGGKKNSATNTQTTIQYSGIVSTTGTANLTNYLYGIQFTPLPQAQLSASRYKPVYNGSVGLLAVPNNNDINLRITLNEYSPCSHLYVQGRKEINAVHRMTTHWINDYFSSIDRVQGLKMDSINVVLIDNHFVEKNYFSIFTGLTNNILNNMTNVYHNKIRNYNLERGYSADSALTGAYTHSKWVSFKAPYHDANLTLIDLHYVHIDNHSPTYSKNELPLVGVEIHYRVTDPNYPKSESRERIIYKVFQPNINVIRNSNQGCRWSL